MSTTPQARSSRLAGPAIALLTVVVTVLALEIGFRLAGFDFEFKARAFNKIGQGQTTEIIARFLTANAEELS